MRDEPQLLRTSVTVGDASTTLSNISTELNDHQQRRTTVCGRFLIVVYLSPLFFE
jgi:hypothetical protein